jgi:hypothetical protein
MFFDSTIVVYVEEFSTAASSTYTALIRPARTHFTHTVPNIACVHLKEYHRRPAPPSTSGSSSREEDPTDDLFVNLRSIHDSIFDPVARALHDITAKLHLGPRPLAPLIIIPDASLMDVPFPSLMSQQRQTAMQRFCVVVSPSLEHLAHSSEMLTLDDTTFMWDTENVMVLPEPRSALSKAPAGAPPSVRRSIIHAEGDIQRLWKHHVGCTRKELSLIFANPEMRTCWILSDPADGGFRCVDGNVLVNELVQGAPGGFVPPSLELLVITNDRTQRPSIHAMGTAASLCLQHGCKRVLRVDLAHGSSVSLLHQQLLRQYLEALQAALDARLDHPYALALQAVQAEALKAHAPHHVWGSLTLVGLP